MPSSSFKHSSSSKLTSASSQQNKSAKSHLSSASRAELKSIDELIYVPPDGTPADPTLTSSPPTKVTECHVSFAFYITYIYLS